MRDLLLHSVSYAGFWGQASLDVDHFVDKAADLGYAGVMLMAKRPHVSMLDYGQRERARLRSRIEARRLEHVCIAGYCNLTGDLDHTEVPHREIHVQYLTELARLTRDLGGRVVRVFTGYEHPSAGYTQQWRMVVEILREASRRAAEFDVIIGVQNHHDIAVGFESQYDLIHEVGEPNCRALFDAWAPALHGVDISSAAAKLAAVTVHTTVADYQLRPRYKYNAAVVNYEPAQPYVQAVPMGEGFLDYPGFFHALYAHGFSGTVAYEMCSPLLGGGSMENLDRYALRFLEYMEQVRPSVTQSAATQSNTAWEKTGAL
jgi:sugar phosphate isomerase/epimerase